MRISSRTDYGVRALFELALNYGQGPIQSREIAARQEVPEAYLHQVLSALSRGGLVKSVRGPSGGHSLALPPSDITIYDAMEVLDGIDTRNHPHRADDDHPVHLVWHEVTNRTISYLRAISLEDLVIQSRTGSGVVNYSI
ncbi:MAG: Rrf2 family transcriptional regulator [Thermomicrobiales bacterium]|nr:Rrf2 family transcriptional regulator [Thermomicrobiales bacterium]